jgi:predicted secreted protein
VPEHRSLVRFLASGAVALALAVTGLSVTATMAQAVSAPGGLKANIRNSSTTVLSWSAVGKAQSYEVQVDNGSAYTSPEYATATTNLKAVATGTLVPGKNYWRVRAVKDGKTSGWANGSFTVAPVTTPIPLAPANGAILAQPQSPPLLQWSSSQGALSYTVEVDGDADLLGAKIYTTRTTSLVVPDPLTTGDWYWRVTANKDANLTSLPSAVTRFDIQALASPSITYPANDVTQSIEDVVLDWTPVPGARSYDVQVALDQGFNNITYSITNVVGSRVSPATTLANDQFWWRVRAVDLAGQPTPWTESVNGFQREWLDQPQAVYPIGIVSTDRMFIQWTPVQHASYYELYIANNPQMTSPIKCSVVGTTFVPRLNPDCGLTPGVNLWWEVRAVDDPYPNGLPGILSVPQAFNWTNTSSAPGVIDLNAVVSGLKVAVNGTGIVNGGNGCVDPVADPNNAFVCTGVPTTPVFSWTPVPGATSYHVDVAQDQNFTTSEMNNGINTKYPIVALRMGDQKSTLPESQAGSAYFWHVTACGTNGCMTSPVSQNPPLPGSEAFRKASPGVAGLATTNPNASEITFSWQDYYDTNAASSWNGESANQTARTYRIQVSPDPSFSVITDTATVDQTTFTAPDRLYADGTYYWRVQALDENSFGLTWSGIASFTKASPAVVPSSPVGGAVVSGTTPFRWSAQPFAASYTVEVYKNGDLSYSAANRVFSATVLTTAVAPTDPLPASAANYLWRVRRSDASGNLGPWSSPAFFQSTGAAPNLLTPKAGVWVKPSKSYFEWTEVPGASKYTLNIGGQAPEKPTTVATAFARTGPFVTGKYTWSVTALDSVGNPLGTSATRTFKIDATPPTVVKVTPATLKPKSDIKVKFSEKVRGVSEKSMKLFRVISETKKKSIKAKVTINKKKTVATVNPKGRLKPGSYVLLLNVKKIRDLRGNRLVPTTVAPTLRVVITPPGRTPDSRDHRLSQGFDTAP